ncbi:GNAT family N-acetyltransferase [Brachybacterium sp. AOP24-D1-21]|uniref:GNAT family N-acetyltransferase n=1 Tax=Brachybacterium sp. AOP24-D1-21 TaxID=3457711 RepID=UPI004034451C
MIYAFPEERDNQFMVLGPGELREMDYTTAEQFGAFRNHKTLAYLRASLDEGSRLYGMFIDGKAVAHGASKEGGEVESLFNGYFPLTPNSVVLHTFHVDSKYRGKGIYKAMLMGLIHRHLRERPSKALVIDTAVSNEASRRGIEAAGFVPVCRLDVVTILRKLVVTRIRSLGEDHADKVRVWWN